MRRSTYIEGIRFFRSQMETSAVDIESAGKEGGEHQADLELAQRIVSGDQSALAGFYTRYIDAVYRFAYHQVGRHRQDAEDVTQETFIAAIKNLKSYRGDSRLYVWLCGIAWHKSGDLRRRRDHAKRPQPTADDQLLQLREERTGQAAVFEMSERESKRQRVWAVLTHLPEHYRHVLVLKYMEEFKVAEIALIMGKTEKAVESLLVRARDKFRAELDHNPETW
jgi:RNA polymerase sigma-70 factor (ECF subfamily)